MERGAGPDDAVSPFLDRPTVVAGPRDLVRRFEQGVGRCAHVHGPIAFAIEGNAERVAEAPGVDLVREAVAADKRVVRRDSVRVAPVDVDAQDFPVERGEILRDQVAEEQIRIDVERIVGAARTMDEATVSQPDIQHPVRTERESAPVVLPAGPLDFEDDPLGARIDAVGIRRRHPELGDPARVLQRAPPGSLGTRPSSPTQMFGPSCAALY